MNKWSLMIDRYIAEGRTVSGGKGDQTAKNAESSQASFSDTLKQVFRDQFGAAKGVFDFLNNKLTAAVDNPQGMSPEGLAATRTNATEQTAGDFANATRAVNNQIASHGGNGLPSGVEAQVRGQVAAAGAQEQSQSQNNISLANEQLRQDNYWKAVGALGNVGAAYNPTAYAGEANSAAGVIPGLAGALQQSKQSGFLSTLGSSFANGLGKTLSGGNLSFTKEL